MPIIFSAIVPHSPILIPQIGKENMSKVDATKKAYQKLAAALKSSLVDTVLIISPHSKIQNEAFAMNQSPEFKISFEEFGDFSITTIRPGNIGLAHKIKEKLETKVNLNLITEEVLDYGTAVPLELLLGEDKNTKIIPLYHSNQNEKAHYEFGHTLKRELFVTNENIAVIASADLSHRLSPESPLGYLPKAKKFDRKLIDSILANKNQDILNLDPKLIVDSSQCGLKPILILLGILNNVSYEAELLSYEAPFGIGYAVINFNF